VGKIDKFPSSPYRFSKTPWAIHCPAPLLGEHNSEIYCNRLGYTLTDLDKLKDSGTI
jgi:CoA:oxalate CoA-transferase